MLKITLILLAALLLWVGLQYLVTQHYIQIGVAQANTAQSYQQNPASPAHIVLVLGDSSAVGVGADTPEHSVAGYLGADFPNAKITNLGVSGLRLAGLIDTLKNLPADTHTDLLILQIGGNDIVNRTPLDQVETQLKEVLTLATPLADQIIMFHGGNVGTSKLLPWPSRWFFRRRTLAVRAIYQKNITDPKFHYIDMFRSHADDPYYQNPSRYYSPDFFHPGPEGYRDWYDLMRQQTSIF
jgi:lysophospholipase L1-like esterase